MRLTLLILIPFLASCGINLDLIHGLAKVTNDNAITIEVQREALNENTNIQMALEIGNPKDEHFMTVP
jgi:hypothetical protein